MPPKPMASVARKIHMPTLAAPAPAPSRGSADATPSLPSIDRAESEAEALILGSTSITLAATVSEAPSIDDASGDARRLVRKSQRQSALASLDRAATAARSKRLVPHHTESDGLGLVPDGPAPQLIIFSV